MPEDVQQVIDPLDGLRNSHRSEPAVAPQAPASAQVESDCVVRAAKAMRGQEVDTPPVTQAVQKTCLVVDDSRVIRKVSSKIAKALGFAPIEAQDGIEALARCKAAMPHLVLTDWDMPEMDGLEFVTKLRAIPTEKPPKIVFCTSKNRPADVQAGIKAGADDYITKPFDQAKLRTKLERLGLV